MKVLVLDNAGEAGGLDLAIRARDASHEVRYWLPPFKGQGGPRPYGDGLVDKVEDYRPWMKWAELIVLTGNADHMDDLAEYFGKGYPIFGTNPKAAALECDRAEGQRVLAEAGIETLPYKVVSSAKEALALIIESRSPWVMKPWGGECDKAMTYVAETMDDAIFTILRWEKEGRWKGQMMMQEKVEGIEIGISGMFGPGGWCHALEESFEHKKFLVGNLGENTGEMGTVIRHVGKSKLFGQLLEPIEDQLHQLNFVGDCNVNCIVDKRGGVWPLEFTIRLGWPDYCIRQAVLRGDPVEWMAALLAGEDRFDPQMGRIAVGVCLMHGDFPRGGDARPKDPLGTWAGYPIYGISNRVEDALHWQEAMVSPTPALVGDSVKEISMVCTAGNFPMVVTGTGETVREAAGEAYQVAWGLHIPSNLMFRTDIGDGLELDLPRLQKHGFAKGMRYDGR
jgi:phosphoribosylamine--glycine ligase